MKPDKPYVVYVNGQFIGWSIERVPSIILGLCDQLKTTRKERDEAIEALDAELLKRAETK